MSERLTAPIKKGDNYSIWHTPQLTAEEFRSLDKTNQQRYLVTCAALAASSHNTQNWAFRLDQTESAIRIFIDCRRILPRSDVNGRQACIGIGCALTNLAETAHYFGLKFTLELEKIDPKDVKPVIEPGSLFARFIPVASFFAEPEQKSLPELSLFPNIFTRTMNRGKYDKEVAIPDPLLEIISQAAKDCDVTLTLITCKKMVDRFKISAIAELQGTADNVVVNNIKFTKELGNWFNENNSDSYLGMPADTFGLGDEDSIKYSRGLRGEIDLSMTDKSILAGTGKAGIESAYAVGMITVKKDTPEYWIRSGMALQKIALLFEKNGFAMAVHAGLAEVGVVSRPLAATLGTTERAVNLFRAGYPKEKYPHAPRLPIDKVIIK